MRTLPAGEERRRATAALDTCVTKIQALQREDGSFAKDGWAPVLSSAFAANGLYAAKDVGAKVAPKTIARSEAYMMKGYDAEKKQFRTNDSAGVALYQAAGSLMGAAQSGRMADAPAKAARTALTDEAFAKTGGEDWNKWSTSIRARLAAIQREDGTWRGDHCITSTSFCTAASLITLAIRPTPVTPAL